MPQAHHLWLKNNKKPFAVRFLFYYNFLIIPIIREATWQEDMDGMVSYNGVHPQRKKLFPLNNRHSLQTNIELMWLGSLDSRQHD